MDPILNHIIQNTPLKPKQYWGMENYYGQEDSPIVLNYETGPNAGTPLLELQMGEGTIISYQYRQSAKQHRLPRIIKHHNLADPDLIPTLQKLIGNVSLEGCES